MKSGVELDVLALEMKEALLALLRHSVRVRVEPYTPPSLDWSAARWRVARRSRGDAGDVVLVVVPEIEGRVQCKDESPKQ